MITKLKKLADFKKSLVLSYTLTMALTMVMFLMPINNAKASGLVIDCNSPNTSSIPGNMRFALDQAGLITFSCNGTIKLPYTYLITANTTIDGAGHSINISGQGNFRIFIVRPGVTLTLKNLTFSNGTAATWNNIVNNYGGAILNQGGKLGINNVHFLDNFANKGGAIYNYLGGAITIHNSFFTENSTLQGSYWNATDGGAIYLEDGSLAVSNTLFNKNKAYDGGAIGNGQAEVTIKDSTFDTNTTQPTVNSKDNGDGSSTSVYDAAGASGGAIASDKSLTISGSTFVGNTASYAGGAIVSGGGLLTTSTFTANQAKSNNGGAFANHGTLQIYTTVFEANQALKGEGGAIYNGNKSTVTLTQSTLKSNQSKLAGGAISQRGYYLEVGASTLYDNTGGQQGGAVYSVSGLTRLSNSTLANNTAGKGGAVATEKAAKVELTNATLASDKALTASLLYNNNAQVSLKNTLVSNYLNGVNCAGSPVVDGGNNLQFPNLSCGSTISSKDPLLMPLGNYGGPTLTMALKIKSPAIDAGSNAVCAAGPVYNRDQRGDVRPTDGNLDNQAVCDIGAFEAAQLAYAK